METIARVVVEALLWLALMSWPDAVGSIVDRAPDPAPPISTVASEERVMLPIDESW